MAAAPDAGLAAICLATWVRPMALGRRQVQYILLLMLLEFIVIHSAAFMGQALLSPEGRAKRAGRIIAFGAFYSVFAGAFSLGFHVWWPLGAFWLLTLNRLAGVLTGQAPAGSERQFIRAGWAASALFYMAAVTVTLLVPLPRLGITPEVVAQQGLAGIGGVWVEQPHRVVAAGCLYYALTAWSELYRHRWLGRGAAAGDPA